MELAEIDKHNQSALSDAESLLHGAIAPFVFIFLAFMLGNWVPEWTVSAGFIAVVCLGVFWFKYFRWAREYASNDFPDEAFTTSVALRRRSAFVGFLGTVLLTALFYVRFA